MHSNTVERIIKDDRYFIEDNLFLPEVIDELREFALTTDVKDDSYDGYYSINYSKGAFPLALLEDTGFETPFKLLRENDFKLGEKVKIKVDSANPIEQQLLFSQVYVGTDDNDNK